MTGTDSSRHPQYEFSRERYPWSSRGMSNRIAKDCSKTQMAAKRGIKPALPGQGQHAAGRESIDGRRVRVREAGGANGRGNGKRESLIDRFKVWARHDGESQNVP
jgi:hypothetical protein